MPVRNKRLRQLLRTLPRAAARWRRLRAPQALTVAISLLALLPAALLLWPWREAGRWLSRRRSGGRSCLLRARPSGRGVVSGSWPMRFLTTMRRWSRVARRGQGRATVCPAPLATSCRARRSSGAPSRPDAGALLRPEAMAQGGPRCPGAGRRVHLRGGRAEAALTLPQRGCSCSLCSRCAARCGRPPRPRRRRRIRAERRLGLGTMCPGRWWARPIGASAAQVRDPCVRRPSLGSSLWRREPRWPSGHSLAHWWRPSPGPPVLRSHINGFGFPVEP